MGAILEESGVNVDVLDLSGIQDKEKLLQTCLDKDPNFIGLTCVTNTYNLAQNLVDYVKKHSNAKILFGGPHAAFTPEYILSNNIADYVCLGEGENTIKQMVVEKKPLKNIDAIAYLNNNDIIKQHQTIPVDLGTMPLAARHLYNRQYDVASIIVNRGCPFQCIYCVRQRLFSKVRLRPVDKIIQELHQVEDLHYKYANLYDNININSDYVKSLCTAIAQEGFSIPWGSELRADQVTSSLAKRLGRAGCIAVGVGVESGSEEVLASAGKYQKLKKVKKGIQLLKDQNIIIQAYFVVGLPGETKKSFEKTLNFLNSLDLEPGVDRVNFFSATPYPGSRLEQQADELGVTILSKNWEHYDNEHILIKTKNLSAKEIESMYKRGKEIEAYYRGE